MRHKFCICLCRFLFGHLHTATCQPQLKTSCVHVRAPQQNMLRRKLKTTLVTAYQDDNYRHMNIWDGLLNNHRLLRNMGGHFSSKDLSTIKINCNVTNTLRFFSCSSLRLTGIIDENYRKRRTCGWRATVVHMRRKNSQIAPDFNFNPQKSVARKFRPNPLMYFCWYYGNRAPNRDKSWAGDFRRTRYA